jgi:hypothetical protein
MKIYCQLLASKLSLLRQVEGLLSKTSYIFLSSFWNNKLRSYTLSQFGKMSPSQTLLSSCSLFSLLFSRSLFFSVSFSFSFCLFMFYFLFCSTNLACYFSSFGSLGGRLLGLKVGILTPVGILLPELIARNCIKFSNSLL